MKQISVWGWAWPGLLGGWAWIGLYYGYEMIGPQLWLLGIALLATVLTAVFVAKLAEYLQERQAAMFDERQLSLTMTADATLLEQARLLATESPELAAEMARRIGRPDLILYPSQQGRRAQIKLAGSDVTLQFALDVLRRSDDTHMAAQRSYQDGTYIYDANRDVADRQQWMQLNWLLSREAMVQRYVPSLATNTAPMWLPPWTRQRIRDHWLLPDDLVDLLKKQIVGE